MKADLLALALVVGGCTWAFRYLPTRLDLSDQPPAGLRARFLAATGPAAIATLAAASLLPMVSARLAETLPLIAGLLGVVAIFGWRRSVVLATLGGAAIYGVGCALV